MAAASPGAGGPDHDDEDIFRELPAGYQQNPTPPTPSLNPKPEKEVPSEPEKLKEDLSESKACSRRRY